MCVDEGLIPYISFNDISDCPFDCTLKNKLSVARKRIEDNEIDMSDWEENTS